MYTEIVYIFASELEQKRQLTKTAAKDMSTKGKNTMREVMQLAWQFIRMNGFNMSEALKTAWRNIKLRKAMTERICKFVFQKIDGTIRIAYGTLKSDIVPATSEERRPNATIQVYYDTEKESWRCFKRAQLLEIA